MRIKRRALPVSGLGKSLAFGLAAVLCAGPALGEPANYNLYGVVGLVDMPTANMDEDATLATTISHFSGLTRITNTFQLTPRISASFRYSAIEGLLIPRYTRNTYYDRSFDLRYQLVEEGKYRPAVAIGLQDFVGTGVYGGEYIVASKEIAENLTVTGGIGWGRLGRVNPIGSMGTRPRGFLATGGVPSYDKWFRGDYAAFGGVAWRANERTTFKLEYSGDDYRLEERSGLFKHKSPFNFGVEYALASGAHLALYSLHGDTVGFQFTMTLNPKRPPYPGGAESAPLPVALRDPKAGRDLGWSLDTGRTASIRGQLAKLMEGEKLDMEGLELDGTRAVVRLRNATYGATPQAIGRTARAMSRVLPASVETFVIVPVEKGMALSAITIQRSDLEALEHAPASEMLARTQITDGFGLAPSADPGKYPKLSWSIGPYMSMSVFDPDSPVMANFGLRASADYALAPGLILSGSLTKKFGGNLGKPTGPIPSGLPRVRTNSAKYARFGDPAIEKLQIAAYGRPGRDLYSRVSAGYLESMYAGISGEVLWKPVNSRLSLGAELNLIKPRAFDQMFGFRTYRTNTGVIPKVNGHVSAYYDFGNGFHGQLDVGRYLAGDYGATLTFDREFRNGWRFGAYATFTDASAKSFGEGSFDKGIRLSVPFSWVLGQPTRRSNSIVLQSLTRDGGARLDVGGRLYERVRGYHRPEVSGTFGRFWR